MSTKVFCILLGAGIGVLNVSGLAASQSYKKPDNSDILRQTSAAYTPWRWIGIRSTGTSECPGIDGFKAKPLLDQTSDSGNSYPYPYRQQSAANRALLRELGLDRFCVYTSDPPDQRSPQQPKILPAGLEAAAPDRMALSTFGADDLASDGLRANDLQVGQVLAAEFLHHVKPSHLQLKGDPDVRITFLDSQPDEETPSLTRPAGSQHGYTLTHLAQQLVCHGRCAARIRSRRILSNDKFDPKPLSATQAGTMGLISELGQKIIDAVNEQDQPGSLRHLILNLSVGWDGEDPLDEYLVARPRTDLRARRISDLEPAVRSVYLALQFAAQKHVLVIASSGNRRGGSLADSNWPVLPAAWELQSPSLLPFTRGPKLIYAVGGVDWQGLPLPNSRTRGLPQRVAYGDHATAEVEGSRLASGQNQLTATYTGTSVSAAVVSATAAVIWHLRPELRPAEVMALIDASSEPLEPKADFYAWRDVFPFSLRESPVIREVSLCAAVESACRTGARCSKTLASHLRCCPLDRQPPKLTFLSTSRPATLRGVAYRLTTPSPVPPCHPSTSLMTADGALPSTPLCPTDVFRSVSSQRWIFSQPGDDPCPKCSLIPPPMTTATFANSPEAGEQYYDLAIAIDPCWIDALRSTTLNCKPLAGKLQSQATLDIDRFDVQGVLINRMTYPIQLDLTGQDWKVSGLGDGKPLSGCRAQLNFVVEKPDGTLASVQNPVVVDP